MPMSPGASSRPVSAPLAPSSGPEPSPSDANALRSSGTSRTQPTTAQAPASTDGTSKRPSGRDAARRRTGAISPPNNPDRAGADAQRSVRVADRGGVGAMPPLGMEEGGQRRGSEGAFMPLTRPRVATVALRSEISLRALWLAPATGHVATRRRSKVAACSRVGAGLSALAHQAMLSVCRSRLRHPSVQGAWHWSLPAADHRAWAATRRG